jgi:ribosome-associated protein
MSICSSAVHKPESPVTATPRSVELALVAAQAAADKIARDVVILDVSDRLVITDCFVVCSAPNERQVGAVVEEVEGRMRENGVKPVRREGDRDARWVLLDFVDVIVHVQNDEERAFYALERLWKDCPTIPFVDRDLAAHSAATDERDDVAEREDAVAQASG